MKPDPPLTFALTLRRWFKRNLWAQRITEDWAKDSGVQHPHGPWASQMCGAMKGDGYNPKAEFFLALADFNHYVARQDFRSLVNTRIKDKLINARALVNDEGQLFSGADLWSLFAGLIQQPAWLDEPDKLTQDIVDEWTAIHRDNFRQLCLKHLVSRAEAWEVLEAKIISLEVTQTPHLKTSKEQWSRTRTL